MLSVKSLYLEIYKVGSDESRTRIGSYARREAHHTARGLTFQ